MTLCSDPVQMPLCNDVVPRCCATTFCNDAVLRLGRGLQALLELLGRHGEPARQVGVLERPGEGLQLQLGGPLGACLP